jgi:hypothetical protein
VPVVHRHQQRKLFGWAKGVPVTAPDTLALIDQEIGRLAHPFSERCSWWQWRKKAWLEGVRDARAVTFENLVAIRARLIEETK